MLALFAKWTEFCSGDPELRFGSQLEKYNVIEQPKDARRMANQRIEDSLIGDIDHSTPTIQGVFKKICVSNEIDCTNIFGSYSGVTAIDHESGAAIDIVADEAEKVKKMAESIGVVCEPHWNNSYKISPVGARGSHLHCTDKYWLEDRLK